MPRGVRKAKPTPAAKSGPKVDLFKTKDIKEDVLIDRVISQAGVRKDDETTGFIKAVLPRFAEASPRQAFSSMSKMVKEFGRGTATFSQPQSNGSDRSQGPSAESSEPQRRKPGRPKGSGKKPTSGGSGNNEKGQAASGTARPQASGERRKPGRPKGSKNRTKSEHAQ